MELLDIVFHKSEVNFDNICVIIRKVHDRLNIHQLILIYEKLYRNDSIYIDFYGH